ncbi:MAG: hypothetical protein CMJ65_17445 [Planctomycetaceae bacterium]|jgi:2',3'-cyclic-nucleotide 2'-phosphodiesterase (5'-nucleotidase family)|nr:hypothetical protein [Planctomycetaceae bacterium]MDP7276325.1 multiheme c-type cytochrome [Planctomycetaceae bacterium]
MPRWVAPILVLLAVAALAAGWFWPVQVPPGPGRRDPDALLDGWPAQDVTLIISGEQHGYMEPCGCSESQSGGFSRRADLFRQLKARGFSPIGLDLGALVKRHRDQSRLKFQTMLAALGDLDYAAVAVGPEDLALGPDFLLSQGRADAADENDGSDLESSVPPLLAANVRLYDSPDLPGAPIASRLVPCGSETIGVTAILGPGLTAPLRAAGVLADVTISPPEEVLPAILADLVDRGATLLVLLSHASIDTSVSLARQFPQLHLVVSAHGPEDPLADNPRQVGSTTVVTVGHKGKYAGVVGLTRNNDLPRLRFELVNLDSRRFHDTPSMAEHMRTYQKTLEQTDLAAQMLPITVVDGREFVGAERCGECHTKAMAQWKQTGHARAYESLARGRAGHEHEWIPRTFDPECLSCHVTGWHPQDVLPYKSGYVDRGGSAHLLGNQCENCHGAGSRHVALVEADRIEESLADVRVTLEKARRTTCIGCHDLDNSPKFDFDSYWPQVAHPGRD